MVMVLEGSGGEGRRVSQHLCIGVGSWITLGGGGPGPPPPPGSYTYAFGFLPSSGTPPSLVPPA